MECTNNTDTLLLECNILIVLYLEDLIYKVGLTLSGLISIRIASIQSHAHDMMPGTVIMSINSALEQFRSPLSIPDHPLRICSDFVPHSDDHATESRELRLSHLGLQWLRKIKPH